MAIAVALYLIIKYWDKIKQLAKKVFNIFLRYTLLGKTISFFIAHWDKFKNVLKIILVVLKALWNAIKAFFTYVFDNIKKFVDLVMSPVKAIKSVISTIGGALGISAPSPSKAVSPASPSYTTNINNQPNITIYTGNMDEGNAYRIGESLYQGFVKYNQTG